MAKKKIAIGDRVFIPELDTYGKVTNLDENGGVTEVIIKTKDGETTVEVKGLEVVLMKAVKWLIWLIQKLFRKKDKAQ
jgi:hypothetical protein